MSQDYSDKTCVIKFIYSEKATKFCEIFTLILSYVVPVKSKVKISQNFVAFSEYMNFNNVFYLSIECRFCLLLQLTKGPRMLHYRTGPFWQQFHPFLHYNDAHIGSIGSLMIAVAAGIAAPVCLRNRALFDPPNTVMSPLSTWPRTPIPHLQQFSRVSTVIYDLSHGYFSRGMYVKKLSYVD